MNYAGTRLATSALIAARSEAARLGHSFIAPEHVVLGLIQIESGIASDVMTHFKLDRAEARDSLERRLPPTESSPTPPRGEIPYTASAAGILKGMMAEADLAGVTYLSTGHLLSAVVATGALPGIAGVSVAELGRAIKHAATASTEHLDLVRE